jgi:ankyrin repeat protein
MNNTPLHYAAASGNENILIYLLEKNARIITSSSGNSPLHVVRKTKFLFLEN